MAMRLVNNCGYPISRGNHRFGQAAPDSNNWLQIIGIAGDARDDGLRKPVKAAIFVLYSLQMGISSAMGRQRAQSVDVRRGYGAFVAGGCVGGPSTGAPRV